MAKHKKINPDIYLIIAFILFIIALLKFAGAF